ncbi:MAG: hypothetical protein M1561_08435, partial [Gammaproteobacteria bacterium]|nr:hypothetical protein [Gammaproteobacteria bacterium]
MKKKVYLVFCLNVAMLFLAGCATTNTPSPAMLGIPAKEWNNYDSELQEQLLGNYQKISSESSKYISEDEKINVGEKALQIKISGGQVMMPPFIGWSSFKPANFIIGEDSCRELSLFKLDNKTKVDLRSCYIGKVLYLDPSNYDLTKKDGSISINYNPLWEQGFTYTGISTTGFARLK